MIGIVIFVPMLPSVMNGRVARGTMNRVWGGPGANAFLRRWFARI